ncbi:MAG: DegT/DnrJ/EryC1/StrS family aminotransferase [Nitrospiria bacterium]
MIQFSRPSLGEPEIQAVRRVMLSGWLAAGKETEAFEREFASYVGVKYAIFTNSCTSALKIAYKYYASKGGERIYYPINTFCATYSAAEEMGLETEAYGFGNHIPYHGRVNVHYAGIKDKTQCFIEDSAHRVEADDTLVGKIRCYSFYATKNMTTGSGGMLVTDSDLIYEYARLCWRDGLTSSTADRHTGKIVDYEVRLMAGGYDGNDLAASIGRVQLAKLPSMIARRNQIRDQYNDAFNQKWPGNHIYNFFVDSLKDVYNLRHHLKERGIASGYFYPRTNWLGVALPIYPDLTDQQVKEVISGVKAL